jgi:hypothetical protein
LESPYVVVIFIVLQFVHQIAVKSIQITTRTQKVAIVQAWKIPIVAVILLLVVIAKWTMSLLVLVMVIRITILLVQSVLQDAMMAKFILQDAMMAKFILQDVVRKGAVMVTVVLAILLTVALPVPVLLVLVVTLIALSMMRKLATLLPTTAPLIGLPWLPLLSLPPSLPCCGTQTKNEQRVHEITNLLITVIPISIECCPGRPPEFIKLASNKQSNFELSKKINRGSITNMFFNLDVDPTGIFVSFQLRWYSIKGF